MKEQVAGGGNGLSCISAPPKLESASKAGRAVGALGTGLAQPWGFFQPCPTDGPLLVLSLVLSLVLLLAWLMPGCPQLPHLWHWPLLASPASVAHGACPFLSAGPRSLSGVGWLGSLGTVQVTSPTPYHGVCWGQCCISLADSVRCPSLVSQRNNAEGLTLPWKKHNPCAWPFPSVGNSPGKDKTWLLTCLSQPEPDPSVCPFAQARTWVPGRDLAESFQGTLLAVSCQG